MTTGNMSFLCPGAKNESLRYRARLEDALAKQLRSCVRAGVLQSYAELLSMLRIYTCGLSKHNSAFQCPRVVVR